MLPLPLNMLMRHALADTKNCRYLKDSKTLPAAPCVKREARDNDVRLLLCYAVGQRPPCRSSLRDCSRPSARMKSACLSSLIVVKILLTRQAIRVIDIKRLHSDKLFTVRYRIMKNVR